MQTEPRSLVARPLQDHDTPAMLQLFREVFGHEMSPAFHAWKYRAGAGCTVGVYRGDELVAHYGGVGADIHYFGKPERAVQIVDVMVKTTARQSVRKGSPFYLAGSAFLERYIGFQQPYLLGYGFPSDRHMALAEHLKLYAPVGRMWELSWTAAGAVKAPGLLQQVSAVTTAGIDELAPALDALWHNLQTDLRQHIVVRKDAAHLCRRYLQHPDKTYRLCLLSRRLGGRPLGVIVLKQEAHKLVLMDYVGALAELPALLKLALYEASRSGCTELTTWCPETFVDLFRKAGPAAVAAKALPITTPANIWTAGPPPADLRDRWWLLPGDTDFL